MGVVEMLHANIWPDKQRIFGYTAEYPITSSTSGWQGGAVE